MAQKQSKWLGVIILVLFIIIIELEPFYRKSLFDMTLEDVPRMQQKKRLQSFFEGVTLLGEGQVPMVGLVIVFNLTNKISALYIVASFGFIVFLNASVMKSFYQEPRPYWVSEEIKPQKCRTDFGNPSGHSMTTSFFWVTLYLNYYFEVGQKKKINTIFCTAYIVKMALTAGLIIFLMFMALSRVFLGEHSYNQVFFGTQLGVFMAVALHYWIKPILKTLPKKLRNGMNSGGKNAFFISPILIVLAVILFFILPLSLAYGAWQYNKSLKIDTSAWDQRQKVFCTSEQFLETTAKLNRGFMQSGVIGQTAGAVLGQLVEMKFLNLNLSYYTWNKTQPAVTAIRIALSLIIFLLLGTPYFLVNTQLPEDQIYYLLGVKHFIPTFMQSFFLFAFARIIFYKIKLINEMAIGRMFENEEVDGDFGSITSKGSNSLEFMEIEMSQKI
ncbi:pap2 superfamily phosphatase [Stylonychia lemnae]|uniref:Pap2 superfamily phosphatase n=1 Tax=Stylonychia lemnae TaxID=5949 RepID=A0A078A7W3_STYLE|nr:pap2 superfamily phosphatase [Stylonychia lemnae]|eukprot:CDW77936.1 pap2 superfamily phosphatase [Stylonychia lemnae]